MQREGFRFPHEHRHVLNDEERRERMNSEEFRNRYTPVEQQMMRNMLQVVP